MQFTGIHEFAVGFEPVEHIVLFEAVAGEGAVFGGDEVQDLIVFGKPEGVLGHILGLITSTKPSPFPERLQYPPVSLYRPASGRHTLW